MCVSKPLQKIVEQHQTTLYIPNSSWGRDTENIRTCMTDVNHVA